MGSPKLRNREEYWYARTAAKQHRCEDSFADGRHLIECGERYIELKLPPGGELGYQGWSRMKVCVPCACRYHRGLVEQLGLVQAVSA